MFNWLLLHSDLFSTLICFFFLFVNEVVEYVIKDFFYNTRFTQMLTILTGTCKTINVIYAKILQHSIIILHQETGNTGT